MKHRVCGRSCGFGRGARVLRVVFRHLAVSNKVASHIPLRVGKQRSKQSTFDETGTTTTVKAVEITNQKKRYLRHKSILAW